MSESGSTPDPRPDLDAIEASARAFTPSIYEQTSLAAVIAECRRLGDENARLSDNSRVLDQLRQVETERDALRRLFTDVGTEAERLTAENRVLGDENTRLRAALKSLVDSTHEPFCPRGQMGWSCDCRYAGTLEAARGVLGSPELSGPENGDTK